jgi:riboflavin synthase
MFTGIITDIGEVSALEDREGWTHLCVKAPVTASKVQIGSSVAVSGVCLTVNSIENGEMNFSLLPETLRMTDIGAWTVGTRVNLEAALRVGDELGGHFVYGHVDGVGKVVSIGQEGESVRIRIELPENLMKYTAPKGSIALDGVSLTIASLGDTWVEVSLVEYTLQNTILGKWSVGHVVHIENDMLLKFVFNHANKK